MLTLHQGILFWESHKHLRAWTPKWQCQVKGEILLSLSRFHPLRMHLRVPPEGVLCEFYIQQIQSYRSSNSAWSVGFLQLMNKRLELWLYRHWTWPLCTQYPGDKERWWQSKMHINTKADHAWKKDGRALLWTLCAAPRQQWWWWSMYRRIVEFCKCCGQCATVAGIGRWNRPSLHPIPVQNRSQVAV